MTRLNPPHRVLITQNALFAFAGSETVTFELAEHFSGLGCEVMVVTHGWSLSWLERFDALESVEVRAFADPELDGLLEQSPPDLAWIHHQLIPERLLRSPGDTRFMFHHMSVAHPSEFPIAHRIETALAEAVLFPAQETLDFHRASGLLDGIDPKRLVVLGNPAPDGFDIPRAPRQAPLGRLLVVSNHIPDELESALAMLDGVQLRVRGNGGRSGSISAPITPADLEWADAVVSIGKTVQYALVAAVPVYCYDHFGGPGWLTDGVLDSAAYSNFSGRGFDRKTATEIASELRSGFARAEAWARDNSESMSARFLVGRIVRTILDEATPRVSAVIEPNDLTAHIEMQKMQGILINVGAGSEVRAVQASDRLRTTNAELEATRHELDSVRAALDDVLGSRTFKAVRRINAMRHGRLVP